MSDMHMYRLKATTPGDTNSNVSTPVAEACQWAVAEIHRLRKQIAELAKQT